MIKTTLIAAQCSPAMTAPATELSVWRFFFKRLGFLQERKLLRRYVSICWCSAKTFYEKGANSWDKKAMEVQTDEPISPATAKFHAPETSLLC